MGPHDLSEVENEVGVVNPCVPSSQLGPEGHTSCPPQLSPEVEIDNYGSGGRSRWPGAQPHSRLPEQLWDWEAGPGARHALLCSH